MISRLRKISKYYLINRVNSHQSEVCIAARILTLTKNLSKLIKPWLDYLAMWVCTPTKYEELTNDEIVV